MSEPIKNVPRRVVTGHDANGVSVVLSDGIVPVHKFMPQDGVGFYEIWATDEMPAPVSAAETGEVTERSLKVPAEPNGTKIRINEFFPGHINELGNQSPIHRTESIDYGIVLEGEIYLVLDDSEVLLKAGDVVVQRGTDHAWANRSDKVARMAFILVDGKFTPELKQIIGDVKLSTGGPHDAH
jgi:quercetin dioxygenase-like cupin family protein